MWTPLPPFREYLVDNMGVSSHQSPAWSAVLSPFVKQEIIEPTKSISEDGYYSLMSITMVPLWHFPLISLLKIQITF